MQVDCTNDGWPIPHESFDLAIFSEVIEHINRHPQDPLSEINRMLVPGGKLMLTTPNVTSFKKVRLLSDGDWDYDSATFDGAWGHRYEYSHYQMRVCLKNTGFAPVSLATEDVYIDDPRGLQASVEMFWLAAAKVFSGKPKQAVKLYRHRGSGLFFLCRKTGTPGTARFRI